MRGPISDAARAAARREVQLPPGQTTRCICSTCGEAAEVPIITYQVSHLNFTRHSPTKKFTYLAKFTPEEEGPSCKCGDALHHHRYRADAASFENGTESVGRAGNRRSDEWHQSDWPDGPMRTPSSPPEPAGPEHRLAKLFA